MPCSYNITHKGSNLKRCFWRVGLPKDRDAPTDFVLSLLSLLYPMSPLSPILLFFEGDRYVPEGFVGMVGFFGHGVPCPNRIFERTCLFRGNVRVLC